MSVSSNITIEIDSKRCGRTYEILRFTEFDISLDLETDADAFDLVAENTNGIYTGLFCRFDSCTLKVNKKTIMKGNIDSVTYFISPTKDYIKISGRDLCWMLVDNDALPDTIENVKPKNYIEQKCKEYGIKCKASKADVYKKLVIGCEESEISIFNNILLDSKQRIWFSVDTLYTGDWSTGSNPVHTFTMGANLTGIPIKSLQHKEDGTDMISQMLVYGSDDKKQQKVMGKFENPFMKKKGIKKRSVRRHYSDSAASKYTSVAERRVRENFRDDTELTITVPIKAVYMPNTTCQVIITKLGINALFFIKAVQYVKSISDGSEARLTLIPADKSFEKLWNSSTAISMTNFTTMSKKLASYNTGNVYKQESNTGSNTGNNKNTNTGNYFPACDNYNGVSIVDGLRSVGANNSYSYRSTIAKANNISGYKGTAAQNTQMLNLLKAGKLKKP